MIKNKKNKDKSGSSDFLFVFIIASVAAFVGLTIAILENIFKLPTTSELNEVEWLKKHPIDSNDNLRFFQINKNVENKDWIPSYQEFLASPSIKEFRFTSDLLNAWIRLNAQTERHIQFGEFSFTLETPTFFIQNDLLQIIIPMHTLKKGKKLTNLFIVFTGTFQPTSDTIIYRIKDLYINSAKIPFAFLLSTHFSIQDFVTFWKTPLPAKTFLDTWNSLKEAKIENNTLVLTKG